MRSRIQIIALVVALVVLSTGLSLWRYVGLERKKSEQVLSNQVGQQASFARQLVKLKNESLQENLIDLVGREQAGRQIGLSPATEAALEKALTSSPFQAIALLRFDGRWQTAWARTRAVLATKWNEPFMRVTLQELPFESAKSNATTWFRATDPSQQPIFLMLSQLKDGNDSLIAVGFLPVTALSDVGHAFLGLGMDVAVIDERGVAVAFTEQSYVGASLVDSYPAVNEILRRREVSGKIHAQNRAKKPILAASEKIEESNLYAIAAVPKETTWAVIPRLIFVTLFLTAGLILIGVILSLRIIRPMEGALRYLGTQLLNLAQGQSVNYPSRGNAHLERLYDIIDKLVSRGPIEVPIKQAESQKHGAYKELSTGLADALRDPLASVLAQAQLARSKAGDELKDHFVIIERETRKARDTIENLLRLSGEDRFPRSKVGLQEAVGAALAAQKGLLSSHNVKVSKDFASTSPIMANMAQLQTAFEEVIKNSVEAMEKNADRNLRISSAGTDAGVSLIIEDNGAGIEKNLIGRIFDPFVTSKEFDTHKGLGLTVVKGIVRSLGGQLRVESAGAGKGAKFIFDFPSADQKGKGEVKPSVVLNLNLSATPELKTPLTGTASDSLPTAPDSNEVTFTGVDAKASEFISAETPAEVDLDVVTARSPKIKEPGT